jgi:hypothetical protein
MTNMSLKITVKTNNPFSLDIIVYYMYNFIKHISEKNNSCTIVVEIGSPNSSEKLKRTLCGRTPQSLCPGFCCVWSCVTKKGKTTY